MLDIKHLNPHNMVSNEESNISVDCILRCKNCIYKVNRKLLSDRCPFFKALFSCHMKEYWLTEVELHDIDPKALEIILDFLQLNKIPDLRDEEELMFSILSATHMFLIADLFEICCAQLPMIINEKNFFDFLDFAEFYDEDNLLGFVIEYLAKNFQELGDLVKDRLTVKDIKLLVQSDKLNNSSAADTINFIFYWIHKNSDRIVHLGDLIALCDLTTLSYEVLEHLLDKEEMIKNYQSVTETLLETFTMYQLKMFIATRAKFQVFFVKKNRWTPVTLLPPMDHDYLRTGIFIQDQLILLSGINFVPIDIHSLFSFNLENSSLKKLLDINLRGHFNITVRNETILILCAGFSETSQHNYENIIYTFNTNTNEFSEFLRDFSTHVVYYIVAVEDSLFAYEEGIVELENPLKRYDFSNKQWHTTSYPPQSDYNHEDNPTICNGKFYIVRTGEELMSLIWYKNQPEPMDELANFRAFGHVRIIDLGNRYLIKAVSRKKTFFKYIRETNSWEKTETTEGPEEIRYVWKGPTSPHLLIPYIYVLGRDWLIYQYNPKNNTWTQLCSIPNKETFATSLPFWSMGC